MRVDLLAVGTELLLGDIVNGNAAWLGQRLAAAGLEVVPLGVVGDNIARIAAAVRESLARADAVILTGGLGPTQDDLTREALAEVAAVELIRDPDLLAVLLARYAALGRTVPERNYRQADLPVGAIPLPNPRGTAPGLWLEVSGRPVVAVPGVPREMRAIVDETVLPWLLRRSGQPAAIVSRTVRTVGLWESVVAERLAGLVTELEPLGNPTVAFLAGGGEVRVRLTAKAADSTAARELLVPVEATVTEALGDAVYGFDDDRLDRIVHAMLETRQATVATAESLTGGLLGARLTEMAGSSRTFRGGVVTYATELKHQLADVPGDLLASEGPVSAATARAMASGVRRRLRATWGLSATGVAGPEAQDGHPVGEVHIGVDGPNGTDSRSLRLPGDRSQVRALCVTSALDLLRRTLAATPPSSR